MNVKVEPADTTPEAARIQVEIFHRMPPGRRLELACRMSNALREVVAAGVRSRHPEYNEEQVRLAVLRLTVGEELFRKARPGVQIEP